MKKYSRLIALGLCMLFTFSNIALAADTTSTTTNSTGEPLKLTVAEAVAYAKEHNYEILLAKIDEQNIKESKNNAKDAVSDAQDAYDEATKDEKANDNFSNYKIRAGYNLKSVKNQETMLNLKNNQKKTSLEISVESAYFNLVERKKAYDIKQETVNEIAVQLNAAAKKLELGTISKLEYEKVALQKENADVSLLNSQLDYKKAKMDFNLALGLPLQQEVSLTDDITYFEYETPTFDEKLEELKKSDTTYVQYVLDKELSDLEGSLIRTYYGYSSDTYKQFLDDQKKALINFNHYNDTMQYNLIVSIINMNISTRNIKNSVKSLDIAKLTLQATKQKYAAGLISDIDMISAQLDYESSELSYIQQLSNYKTSVMKFEKNV